MYDDSGTFGLFAKSTSMKNYCFGDSFIGMFNLADNCEVYKFKGATAKGLSRPGSENLRKIKQVISGLSNEARNKSCFLFQFGSVDVHHSYYYRLFSDETFDPLDIAGFINPIVEGYVTAVVSLKCKRKVILAPHYSPIEARFVLKSLRRYGAITEDQEVNADAAIKRFLTSSWRKKIVDAFCDKLHQEVEGKNIFVVDLRSVIASDGIIHRDFIDISVYNIHIMWEALMPVYVRYLNRCGITEDHIDYSRLEEYLDEKRIRVLSM